MSGMEDRQSPLVEAGEAVQTVVPPEQWRHGGDEERDPFFVIDPDGDYSPQQMAEKQKKLDEEHGRLREDYLSTPPELFNSKRRALEAVYDRYFEALRTCGTGEIKALFQTFLDDLRQVHKESPRTRHFSSGHEIALSGRADIFSGRLTYQLEERRQKLLGLIEEQHQTLIDARHPTQALNELGQLSFALRLFDDDHTPPRAPGTAAQQRI